MNVFESEGRSVEEALERLCEEHHLSPDELEYTVIDEKKKILGLIGRDSVTVKAWLKHSEDRAPARILEQICERAGFLCKISSEQQEDHVTSIELTGADLKIIIGKNGEVLDALQYLINKIVNRGVSTPRKVFLDADGYRQRKIDSLKRLAGRTAEQVKKSGKSVVLNPMNAHDRRIVHLELKEDQEVFTKSLGEGPFKKVMIGSKRNPRGHDRNKRR
jgi:spoIIIJ-associated protein